MSGMCAGALSGWRERLERSNRARGANAEFFAQALSLPRVRPTPYLRLPLLASSRAQRDGFCAEARTRRLGISTLYPEPISWVPELRERFVGARFPAAEAVAERLLCLSTHEELTDRDRAAIVRAVRDGLGEDRGVLEPVPDTVAPERTAASPAAPTFPRQQY
jgi:dTDP-4-amino-4,6-dideoxygalactose transaminase